MRIDVLIVGQGLAGSLLAWELMQRQYRVMVVDTGEENASRVAAGLINPVSGQRLVKCRHVELLLPAAMQCYQHLASVFRQAFFVDMPMLRILQNERERDYAGQRLHQDEYRFYLKGWLPTADPVNSPFGVLQQTQTGYLRTGKLLDQLRSFFIGQQSYIQTRLDYNEVDLQPGLRWRHIKPRHIVFCEGHKGAGNPWFGKLPFQLVKGEILSCESSVSGPKHILNYGHWLIPLEDNRFKTGATFDRQYPDILPTSQAETALLTALYGACPGMQPVSVYEHKAGIRPATLDKQPFIGPHPRFADLHIFNGFGAKGSLSIPWYARQFIAALEQQEQLSPHCGIQRFNDAYFVA